MQLRNLAFRLLAMVLMGVSGSGMLAAGVFAAESQLVVFAAASTTNALNEIGGFYAARNMGHLTFSFASSSTLAKQIANGAPADVFLSANEEWMDFLEQKGAIAKASRIDLLGNRIVFIVPLQSSIQPLDVKKGLDLSPILGKEGRFSMGDPGHVPAGLYGKNAMETLGLWEQVKDRLVPMKDVRAALVLVEREEAPLGLVYTTDAAISKKVRVVGTFPVESHSPIIYPAAVVAGGKAAAAASFLKFLKTPEARAVFMKYGFEVR